MAHRSEASQAPEQYRRFKKLAEQLINVPKPEIDAEKEKYEKKKKEKTSG